MVQRQLISVAEQVAAAKSALREVQADMAAARHDLLTVQQHLARIPPVRHALEQRMY